MREIEDSELKIKLLPERGALFLSVVFVNLFK